MAISADNIVYLQIAAISADYLEMQIICIIWSADYLYLQKRKKLYHLYYLEITKIVI